MGFRFRTRGRLVWDVCVVSREDGNTKGFRIKRGPLAFVLVLTACSGGAEEVRGGESVPVITVSPSATPSPSPTPPPKPARPWEAQLVGKYEVTYTLISTNVDFTGAKTSRRVYVIDPKCPEGPCDVRVTAKGGSGWETKALFLREQGRYRWVRRYDAYTCRETDIPANGAYLIRPLRAKLNRDLLTWVVSKFEGTLHEQALKTGGCFPLGESRYVLRGKLIS